MTSFQHIDHIIWCSSIM